jgi:hypothetical protein
MTDSPNTADIVERLNARTVLHRGETVTIDLLDGNGPQEFDGGEIVQLRNPDGPDAAALIESMREALLEIRDLRSDNYDSDRAWALAMRLRASCELQGWLGARATLAKVTKP